jgi:hypothetical protein
MPKWRDIGGEPGDLVIGPDKELRIHARRVDIALDG